MAPELFYARAIIMHVRYRAEQARRAGRNELGASAIEWAIISAVVVGLALVVFNVVKGVVDSRAAEIETGAN